MRYNKILKSLGFIVFAMSSASISAQDVIAHQAASDRQMKDIKSTKIIGTSYNLQNPASEIYTNWNNKDIRGVTGMVPAKFKIDLRHFCMPTTNRKVNSNFGRRWGRRHEGMDVKVYVGDTIRAAFDGKVRIVRNDPRGYGQFIVIRHTNGLETLYGHLSRQLVRPDEVVMAGQPIGLGGNTGRSTGSHLHFETRLLGEPIDPSLMFDFENQDVKGDFFVSREGRIEKDGRSSSSNTAIARYSERRNNSKEVEQVAVANNDNNEVKTNQSRKVARQKNNTYTVKKGDTLYSIAKSNGLTVKELCKLNGMKPNSKLYTGKVLKCS